MGGVEREEQRHDRVPRVGPDRTHQIAANFTLEASGGRHVPVGRLVIDCFILTRLGRSDRQRIEDAQVPRKPGNHEVLVQGRHNPRRDGLAGVHQHFDPFSKAIHVELFVSPRPGVAPQVEVENRRQLRGCCGGDSSPRAWSPPCRMS